MRENIDQCVSAAARDTGPITRVKSWVRNLGSLEATTHSLIVVSVRLAAATAEPAVKL